MKYKQHFRMQRAAFLLLTTLALLFSGAAWAQAPFFTVVRTPESMREAVVNCIYQDAEGFLWIGTSNGLYKYDGRNFQSVEASAGKTPLQISAIYMDPAMLLWVGTKTGKIFQLKGDSLQPFSPQEGLPAKAITGFTTDKSGNLWFSTYGEGLYYFNGRYIYNINTDDGLSDDYCYGILSDDYGRIWTGTDEGISVCYVSGKMKKVDRINTDNGLPDNIVLKLSKGKKGTIWAGMQDGGFCSVNTSSMKVNVPAVARNWQYGPVRDILVYNELLWLSSEKNGVLEAEPGNPGSALLQVSREKIPLEKVNCLLADNQGNTWIVTNSELVLSSGPGLRNYQQIGALRPGSIQAILSDHLGRIYFSHEGELMRFDPGNPGDRTIKKFTLPVIRHTHVISLYEDTAGFIWAGTFGEGAFRINPETGRARLIGDKEGLTNGNILSIDGRGEEIWFATLGGAYRCILTGNPDLDDVDMKFGNFSQENGPGNNYIYKVLYDCHRRVWFGTDGKGVSVFENGRFRSFGEKDGIRSKVIYSITEDRTGSIWLTSSKEGVYRYDGKKFRNYTLKDGLSDLQISCMGTDRNNNVYFANERGIDIMDIRTGTFTYLGEEQGLENIDPDLNVLSVSLNGQLWIGTRDGIIRLEPEKDAAPRQPVLKLNKVSVFLSTENYIDAHEFNFSQNHLSFFYNATWFSSPDLVTYQVKLEGYDLDWINTRDNLVTYSNLPPGKYTFLVRAALRGNYTGAKTVAYTFTIQRPFWKTAWFIIGGILIIAVSIILMIRIRDERFQQREAVEREKLLFQFQTLRSQVNPHFLFNSFSTLMSVIDENKDLAIEYVEKLSQFFRNILEYRDKDLIPLEEELKLIDTYRYLQHQRYGDNFRMDVHIRPDDYHTLIPPLTLQMLVENAIKHNVISEDKPLTVEILTDSGHIIIRNNLQRKKLVEASTGLGLENIRNRYRLMGQTEVSILEEENTFTISLPLIKP